MAVLRYDLPAEFRKESHPLGNARTGVAIYGGTQQKRINLNENALWSGRPQVSEKS